MTTVSREEYIRTHTIVIDDLHQYLIDHKDDIDFVILQWTVGPFYALVDTGNYGIALDGEKVQLYAEISYGKRDPEYSFVGSTEKAIEYTSDYDQWNGLGFLIRDGILMGEYDSYNPDSDQFHEREDDVADENNMDIEYMGLCYFWNYKKRRYDGPITRE